MESDQEKFKELFKMIEEKKVLLKVYISLCYYNLLANVESDILGTAFNRLEDVYIARPSHLMRERMEMENSWDTNMDRNAGQKDYTWDTSTINRDVWQMNQTRGYMCHMDRHVREMEVDRILFGDRPQMDKLGGW